MPIPSLDQDGYLPLGIHDCSLQEVQNAFGLFRQSDHRVKLFSRLQSYIQDLKSADIVHQVYIDGSFVTSKPEPGDIDLIAVTAADFTMPESLSPVMYNSLSARMVKKTYRFDMVLVPNGGVVLAKWLDFFQEVKNVSGRRKGILRVSL